MTRYAKVAAGLGVVAGGVLGVSAFNWSFDVANTPEVSANVLAPQFSYRCIESAIARPFGYGRRIYCLGVEYI